MRSTSADYVAVGVAGYGGCGLKTDGTIACWQSTSLFSSSQCGGNPPSGSFSSLAVGPDCTSCAVGAAGAVSCWGSSFLLDPVGAFRSVAVADGTCGVTALGAVACVGADFAAVAADGGAGDAALDVTPADGGAYDLDEVPVPVLAGDDFASVATVGSIACGLTGGGAIVCSDPAVPALAGTFTSVSLGRDHVCALRSDATAVCAPFTGTEIAPSTWPDPPSGAFTAISAGSSGACGLKTDGTLACWGIAGFPLLSPPSGTFSAVSLGAVDSTSCAVGTDGHIVCWGLLPVDEQGAPLAIP